MAEAPHTEIRHPSRYERECNATSRQTQGHAWNQAILFAEVGGLMSWAPKLEKQYRMAARYAAKILEGANPGELPITYPSEYYLTINPGAARRLGLTLPPTLLIQAERVLQ